MADPMHVLSQGCLARITAGGEEIDNPVFQVLQIKPMASTNGRDRWRIVMSDSVNFIQTMLTERA